ncbi:hypothetical protein cypCar_00038100 [Cyprinus carpio]|nr:hypothetical protein cypCar_00038100 [Cyprinus carpio]
MVAKGIKQRLILNRSSASDEGHYKMVVGRVETAFKLTIETVKIKKTPKNQIVTKTQEAVFSIELTHLDVKGSQ